MRRALSRDEAEITVVERNDRQIYQPGFVPLLFDLEKPENLQCTAMGTIKPIIGH